MLLYMKFLPLLGTAIFVSLAGAQEPLESKSPTPMDSGVLASNGSDVSPRDDLSYRIGPGDVLEVRVFGRPQLSRDNVRVSEGGTILMPLIGEVKAACRTEPELADAIRHLYTEYQKDPQVDVFIKDYHSQTVAVIGAVKSPGRFQLRRNMRVLEMLSFVGGPDPSAGRTVQVIRNPLLSHRCDPGSSNPGADESEDIVESFELAEVMRGIPEANPYVRPGDIITILIADQVYVVGNVLRPSAVPLTEPLTVSRAIAMVGGTLADTKSDRVRIVRQLASGAKSELRVDLKAIERRNAEDILLQPNDIIDVPTSEGKRFIRSLLGVIAPSVGGLPVRVIH